MWLRIGALIFCFTFDNSDLFRLIFNCSSLSGPTTIQERLELENKSSSVAEQQHVGTVAVRDPVAIEIAQSEHGHYNCDSFYISQKSVQDPGCTGGKKMPPNLILL